MANQFLFANFFATELVSAVTVSDTVLSIPPDASMALQNFTSGFYAPLTLWDGQNPPEIVWCTQNPQTGLLTVLRAQEGTSAFGWAAGTQVISSLTAAVINAALLAYNTGLVLMANYLPLSGGTLTGPLILGGPPTVPNGAATKGYVDGSLTGLMPLTGGTFSGDISMSGHRILQLPAPATAGEPATKAYVDADAASVSSYVQDVSGLYVTTGSGSAYALNPGKYGAGLTDGVKLAFRLHVTNRASPTLAVDGTAAVPLRWQSGSNANPAIWADGMILEAEYNASGPEWLVFGNDQPIETQITAGGPLNYTLASGLGITSLEDGLDLCIQLNATNTGAVTLNVDGLGAVPLRAQTGVDFKASQLIQYTPMRVRYNNATAEWLMYDQDVPRLDQCADVAISSPVAGQALTYNGTKWINQRNSPRGYIDGLTLSNDAITPNTIIDIAAGTGRADDDSVDIVLSAITKLLNAVWAAGTNAGGLDTGAIAASTWYYVYAIYNPSTLATDVVITTTYGSPTLPSGFTKKRYIGPIRTDGSSHILPFIQLADEFLWGTQTTDQNGNPPNTNAQLVSLTVPPVYKTIAIFGAIHNNSNAIISSPDTNDAVPGATTTNFSVASAVTNYAATFRVRTNATGQIRYRSNNTTNALVINTYGWVDHRGKNA